MRNMKRGRWVVASMLLALALAGCVTPDAAMRSWVGQHSSSLVARFGPPSHRESDGQGGEIWIYQTQRTQTTPGSSYTSTNAYGQSYGTSTYNPYVGGYGGVNYAGNSNATGTSVTTYSPPQTRQWTAIRSYFIDRDGRIYNYSWSGL